MSCVASRHASESRLSHNRRSTSVWTSPDDFPYVAIWFHIYRQTIPHMSPNDFLLFSTYSWHQSAGGGKQFCLTAFETWYFWTIAKVPKKRATFYWYLKTKTRNLLIYEGIWSSKHKNICNFFNSCHTSLKLRLYKWSFFGFFNFFDSSFLIPSDMNTTLDNRMLTTVCDTQKLCSYMHVFPPLCGHTSSAWMRSTDTCISGVIRHTSPPSPPLTYIPC